MAATPELLRKKKARPPALRVTPHGAPRSDRPTVIVPPPRWLRRLTPLLIVLITVAAFLPTLQNGFVAWDDDENLLDNVNYRGLGWTHLRWMWTTVLMGHYIPLTWMTLGMDYVLWGMNPFGYHLTSLLLHAATAVVFYFLALRVLAVALPGPAERRRGLVVSAALAALVFSIHPLRVESVAWATERRDVLSGLFYLLAILAYVGAWERRERGRRWYWLSLGLFSCALLSKSMSVSLPLVLLILDIYPLRRVGGSIGWWNKQARRVYAQKIPFVALAAAISVITFRAQLPMNHMSSLAEFGMSDRLAISAYSLSFYLWKTIVPLNLSPLYPLEAAVDPWRIPFILSYALVLTMTAVAVACRRRWPALSAVWATYVVILLPVLGVFQNGPQIAADRYTYVATLGWALLVGAGVLLYWQTWSRVVSGAAICVLTLFAVLTWNQVHVWHDSDRLWTRVLAIEPNTPIAENNLGVELDRRGRFVDAIAHYQRAITLRPDYALAHHNLGQALNRRGDQTAAIEHFQRALSIRPDLAEAHNDWGVSLVTDSDIGDAINDFLQVLSIRAAASGAEQDVHRNRKLGEAIGHFRQAITMKPSLAIAHANWGLVLIRQGKPSEAIEHFHQALRVKPDFIPAQVGLALARQGKLPAPRDYRLAPKPQKDWEAIPEAAPLAMP